MTSQPPELVERQRRISVEEYHRMIDAGILAEDEHVQLLDGVLVAMTPQHSPHAYAIQQLTRLLTRALSEQYAVRPQLPLTLADDSEPEPDVAVVRANDTLSATAHPRTALLVIEVSGESLRLDRKVKGGLYARARVPEYWIVNVDERVVEVHTQPDPQEGLYRSRVVLAAGERLIAASLPAVAVSVSELFL